MGIKLFPHLLVLLVLVLGQANSQLFDSTTVTERDTVTLTCDARKAAPGESLPTTTTVTQLLVEKKGPNDNDFQELASYFHKVVGGTENKDISSAITNSRGRIVATLEGMFPSGSTIGPNVNSMKILIRYDPIECGDEAIYRCKATYQDSEGKSFQMQTDSNLTISEFSDEIISVVTPDRIRYKEDENVTFSCRTDGPTNVAIRWKYKICPTIFNPNPGWQDWFPVTDINTPDPTGRPVTSTAGCSKVRFESELRNVQLQNGARTICQIQCLAGKEVSGRPFEQHQEWNMTIEYDTTDDGGGGTGAATSSGGDDVPVGAIVGPIVGVLVLIAVVAVLLYFFWYRKRSREDDYRDDADKPDARDDPNLHAAPPVFYTKPDKSGKEKDNTTAEKKKSRYDDYDDYDHRGKPSRYSKRDEDNDRRSSKTYSDRDDKDSRSKPYYSNDRDNDSRRSRSNRPSKGEDDRDRRSKPYYNYGRDDDNGSASMYTSTDMSRSEDEYLTGETGGGPVREKPRPKRRSRVPGRGEDTERDRRDREDQERPLHYAELDLKPRGGGEDRGEGGRRPRREDPVAYASIQV